MKQQRTLIYFISGLILIFGVSVHAQNDSIAVPVKGSLTIKEKYGIRVGADLSKLARTYFDEAYNGFEITADFRLKKNLYIAGEIGFDEKNTTTEFLDISTQGSYLKVGADFNIYENWLDMDNMIYAGLRVGFSTFSHNLNSYTVYNTNAYWAPHFTTTELQEFDGLNATWAECIFGIKVELFNNLFVGLLVQLKYMVNETVPDNFGNIYIPGFNKTFDTSRIGVGYGYTLSYRIPFFKKEK